jgi:hypothetical protein
MITAFSVNTTENVPYYGREGRGGASREVGIAAGRHGQRETDRRRPEDQASRDVSSTSARSAALAAPGQANRELVDRQGRPFADRSSDRAVWPGWPLPERPDGDRGRRACPVFLLAFRQGQQRQWVQLWLSVGEHPGLGDVSHG